MIFKRISLPIMLSLVVSLVMGQMEKQITSRDIYDSLFLADDWRIRIFKNTNFDPDAIYGIGWRDKMLKIGDKMPDLSFGEIMNNIAGKTTFSDFAGKIVILDFWTTGCKSCIAAFPKMETLQRKFKDQIQIILVNSVESAEQIKKRFPKKVKWPELPILSGAKYLYPYFPHIGVPQHVWLDQAGVVRVIGSALNTYEKKIQALLAGLSISSLSNESVTPRFVPSLPYHKIIRTTINNLSYNSVLTPFNNDYATTSGGKIVDLSDSSSGTIRTTFVNQTAEVLYRHVLSNYLKQPNHLILIGYSNNFQFNVNDTSRYTYEYINWLNLLDTEYTRSQFCYEQIVPATYSKHDRDSLMLKDLNEYFGKLYGTEGRFVVRSIPHYVLIRGSDKANSIFSRKGQSYKADTISNSKKRLVKYTAVSLASAIRSSLDLSVINEIDRTKAYYFMLDEALSNLPNINIILPANATIEQLRPYLKKYGFDIIKRNYNVNILQITDTKP